MPSLQLRFTVGRAEAEALVTALEALDAQAVTLECAGADNPVDPIDESLTLWNVTAVAALFDAATDRQALLLRLAAAYGRPLLPPHHADTLEDQDWNRAAMDRFQPLRFGRRLWVCPSWHAPPDPDGINVILDPGMAFGTGTHPTTAMCLHWLDGAAIAGRTVLDYGCGSGILAIAALKLGARSACAVDIDPQCLAATRENAAHNEVSNRLTVCEPHGCAEQVFDVLLANILAGPLIELAPLFAQAVRPGGDLVLSGLLASQAPPCMEVYASFFELDQARRDSDWVMLTGRRR